MMAHRLTHAIALAILLAACRSRERPAAGASGPVAGSDPTPAPAAGAEPAEAGAHEPGLVSDYEVSPEELRRSTFLKTAVLIHPAGADDAIAALFDDTGVRFGRLEGTERFGQYSCGGVEEEGVRAWLDLTARELGLHSPALVRHSGTRWVVFCRDLRQGGQARAAIPNGPAGTLLVDPGQFAAEDDFRRYLHHELFHMIDFADGRSRVDAEWAALNGPGAGYGRGGRWAQGASSSLGSGAPGYVTEYAASAVEEDKAEIFRLLVLAPGELGDLAGADPVIAAKRELLLRRLGPYCADARSRAVCTESGG